MPVEDSDSQYILIYFEVDLFEVNFCGPAHNKEGNSDNHDCDVCWIQTVGTLHLGVCRSPYSIIMTFSGVNILIYGTSIDEGDRLFIPAE